MHAPLDEVATALVREGVEAVAGHDLCADHVRALLLGVIVAACAMRVSGEGLAGDEKERGEHARSGLIMPGD